MTNPQQPELRRSERVPFQNPDAVEPNDAQELADERGRGPVPPENQPGHHPEKEQDKPE